MVPQNARFSIVHRVSKRDGKKMYYLLVRDPLRSPDRKTHTLRTKDKKIAEMKMFDLQRQYLMGLWDPWVSAPVQQVTFARALAGFADYVDTEVRQKSISRNHANSLVQSARQLKDSLPPEKSVSLVSAQDVEAFVWGYDNENTRWQHYARLKRFFAWCLENAYVPRNVVLDAKRPNPPKRKPPRYVTAEEFERIRGAAVVHYHEIQETGASPDDAVWWPALLTFAVWTGLRVGEIRTLRWQDVDMAQGLIRVQESEPSTPGPLDGLVENPAGWPGFSPKWGKARTIPILPECQLALLSVEDGGHYPYGSDHVLGDRLPHRLVWPSPHGLRRMSHGRSRSGMLSRDSIEKAWNVSRGKAGVGDSALTFHTTRHTYASWCLQRGVQAPVLQKLLGHEHLHTTMIYAHLGEGDVMQAVREAFGGVHGAGNG